MWRGRGRDPVWNHRNPRSGSGQSQVKTQREPTVTRVSQKRLKQSQDNSKNQNLSGFSLCFTENDQTRGVATGWANRANTYAPRLKGIRLVKDFFLPQMANLSISFFLNLLFIPKTKQSWHKRWSEWVRVSAPDIFKETQCFTNSATGP